MKTLTKNFYQSVATAAVVIGATAMVALPAQARDLSEIRANTFQVVNSGAYPPFSYVNKQGNLVGFDVDIAKALAKKMDVDINVKSSPWSGIIAAIAGGRFDACVCSMSNTKERRSAVDFTDTYYRSGLSVWVQDSNDEIHSIDDFSGKRIGTTLGETANQWAVERGDGKWSNQTFQGLPDMLNGLTTGRVDAIIGDDVPILVAMRENAPPIKRVDVGKLPRFPAAIAVQKDHPELVEALNNALAQIKSDGTYQDIADKWIGEGADIE